MGDYVTPQGLALPSVQDILADLADDQRSTINPNLNTDPDSPIGQLNGIFASALGTAYEALEIAFNGNNPDAAEGFLLETVSAITGTKRAPATPSKLTGNQQVTVNLNPNTLLPSGSQASVLGNPTVIFQTTADFTAPNVGSAANYSVDMQCTQTGPIVCNANTLTVIVTPVVGWNSVTNPFDAVLGTNVDTDPQLRYRRESELRATGKSTVDAIRDELLAFEFPDGSQPISQCIVFQNDQDFTDTNGLPPHSIRCLVFDGVNAVVPNGDIAQIIWNTKPGGIQMTGNTSGPAVDAAGNPQTVPFSRPAILEIVFSCTLTLANSNQTPSQYLAAVQAAIVTGFLQKVTLGSTIYVRYYEGLVCQIPGINDCEIQLGIQGDPLLPVDTNLVMGTFQMGDAQTTNITVQ